MHATVEALESRRLLTTFIVDTPADASADVLASPDGRVTLREAVIAANTNAPFGDAPAGGDDDEIRLRFNGGAIRLEAGELAITDGLTINAAPERRITISGGGQSRLFNVGFDVVVRLRRLQLVGGNAGDGLGGMATVDSLGRLLLNDVQLFGGNAAGGGQIYVSPGGDLGASDCLFSGGDAGEEGGGAIVGEQAFLSLKNCLVERSQTSGDGGGIRAIGGVTSLRNVALRDNSGTNGGGLWSSSNQLFVSGFAGVVGNVASGDGGGIYAASGDEIVLNNPRITGNVAGGNGGGVAIGVDAEVFITSPRVTANTATNGGGVAILGRETFATVRYGDLRDNVATRDGGGLYVNGGFEVFVEDVRIARNTAANGGGGISLQSFDPFDGFFGSRSGTELTLRRAIVQDNVAAFGGGIGVGNEGQLALENTLVRGNAAVGLDASGSGGRGGGIYIRPRVAEVDAFVPSDYELRNSRLLANTATRSGGGLWFDVTDNADDIGELYVGSGDATIDMIGGSVQRNRLLGDSAEAGAGIGVIGGLRLDGVKILQNTADDPDSAGGGVYARGLRRVLSDADGEITDVDDLGALDIIGGDVIANVAGAGGGVYADYAFGPPIDGFSGGAALSRVEGTVIAFNTATAGDGGGARWQVDDDNPLIVANARIVNNRAPADDADGGGLWANALQLRDTVVRGNVAGNAGGGLTVSTGRFDNASVSRNRARDGGGLAVDGIADLVGSILRANVAQERGGGIFNGGPALGIVDTRILSNAADAGGGIFTAADATTTVGDGTDVSDNDPDDLAGPGTVA